MPFSSPAQSTSPVINVLLGGQNYRTQLTPIEPAGRWLLTLDGKQIEVDLRTIRQGCISLILNGRSYECFLEQNALEQAILIDGRRYTFTIDDPRSLAAMQRKSSAAGGTQIIQAPMPGRIVRFLVSPGEAVASRQGLLVIEAMKMQNELKAARPGVVHVIHTQAGEAVLAGQALLTIE